MQNQIETGEYLVASASGKGEAQQWRQALDILREELAPYFQTERASKGDVEAAALRASRRILVELGGM